MGDEGVPLPRLDDEGEEFANGMPPIDPEAETEPVTIIDTFALLDDYLKREVPNIYQQQEARIAQDFEADANGTDFKDMYLPDVPPELNYLDEVSPEETTEVNQRVREFDDNSDDVFTMKVDIPKASFYDAVRAAHQSNSTGSIEGLSA